ncbi:Right handed beta helix region [Candidatus Gugararchaeum adminiculabundum]|nr:Right handed beta helix region [Candidatus Gugararchaeum adminiculabundum]
MVTVGGRSLSDRIRGNAPFLLVVLLGFVLIISMALLVQQGARLLAPSLITASLDAGGGALGVDACDEIVSQGIYTLTDDVSASGDCFVVSADDVTLDCNYHNITGLDSEIGAGVNASGRLNLTVENCNISNFRVGVYFNSTNSSQIINSTVWGNTFSGITLEGAASNSITNNTISYNNGYYGGISLYLVIGGAFPYGNNITSNFIYNNSIGITSGNSGVTYGEENNISFNDIYNNSNYGITNAPMFSHAVDARDNYWGTASCSGASNSIYAPASDVTFRPFLNESFLSPTTGEVSTCVLCGDEIMADTVLTDDLNGTNKCFEAFADGVTLDCNGHAIAGNFTTENNDQYSGIKIDGHENVAIENCRLVGFVNGIRVTDSSGVTIRNVTAWNNSEGISLNADSHVSLIGVETCNNSGSGIVINMAEYTSIEGSRVWNNGYASGGAHAIANSHSNFTTITGSSIFSNFQNGIEIEGSYWTNITNNDVYSNGFAGIIAVFGSNYADISRNNASSNLLGIVAFGAVENSTISKNNVSSNTLEGIALMWVSSRNNVTDNIVSGNEYGIALMEMESYAPLAGNSYNNILRNNITENLLGIYVYDSENNTFEYNNIVKGPGRVTSTYSASLSPITAAGHDCTNGLGLNMETGDAYGIPDAVTFFGDMGGDGQPPTIQGITSSGEILTIADPTKSYDAACLDLTSIGGFDYTTIYFSSDFGFMSCDGISDPEGLDVPCYGFAKSVLVGNGEGNDFIFNDTGFDLTTHIVDGYDDPAFLTAVDSIEPSFAFVNNNSAIISTYFSSLSPVSIYSGGVPVTNCTDGIDGGTDRAVFVRYLPILSGLADGSIPPGFFEEVISDGQELTLPDPNTNYDVSCVDAGGNIGCTLGLGECGSNDDCCSGNCDGGVCSPSCSHEGEACGGNDQCCGWVGSGDICRDNVCIADASVGNITVYWDSHYGFTGCADIENRIRTSTCRGFAEDVLIGNGPGNNFTFNPDAFNSTFNITPDYAYPLYLNIATTTINPHANITAANNWWGTNDTDEIGASILDSHNYSNLGTILFEPFLVELYTPEPSLGCGEVINQSKTLTGDLLNCDGIGLVINASNIVLDCNGRLIRGDGISDRDLAKVGITNAGWFIVENIMMNNITIKNCRIENFGGGAISLGLADNSTIMNNTIVNNTPFGIFLVFSNNVSITDNTIVNNSLMGIALEFTSESNVRGNNISSDGGGIWMFGGERILDLNETEMELFSELTGIDFLGGKNIVDSNAINGNLLGVVVSAFSDYNNFTNNTINNNYAGIVIAPIGEFGNSSYNYFSGNGIGYNGIGVYIDNSTNNTFFNNSIYGSTNYSFVINISYLTYGNDSNVDATYNYWGTTDVNEIRAGIYDWANDSNLGNVTFMPFLMESGVPLELPPPPPPLPATTYECGGNITESSLLANDLTGCPGNALNITADNVVFDCGGRTISTNNYWEITTGIEATNRQNVIVKNCVIKHFYNGVMFFGTNHTLVRNNTVYGKVGVNDTNVSYGIAFSYGDYGGSVHYPHFINNTIDGNLISNATTSITMFAMEVDSPDLADDVIENNYINAFQGDTYHGPGMGIWVSGVNMSIVNNTLVTRSNAIIGIFVIGGGIVEGTRDNFIIANNTVDGRTVPSALGMLLYSLSGSIVERNTILNMTGDPGSMGGVGIMVGAGTNGTTIRDNVVYGATIGIMVNDVYRIFNGYGNNTYNNFTGNNITYAVVGILVANNSVNNTFEYNNIVNSTVFAFVDNNTYAESGMDANISAINNYWGTADEGEIRSKIYDYATNPSVGNVTFVQYLGSPYHPHSADCGREITTSTTLAEDLVYCPGNGLSVNASNIVLDCNGHSISGQGRGGGIYPSAWLITDNGSMDNITLDNVTVKNCVISNFAYGIGSLFTKNCAFTNNTIVNNAVGIILEFANNNTITGNTILNSTWPGLTLMFASNNVVTGNNVSYNLFGGILIAGYNLPVGDANETAMELFLNQTGIGNLSGGDNIIASNTISNNALFGVLLSSGASHNNFTDNTIDRNGAGIGMYSFGGGFVNCTYNNFFRNSIGHNTIGILLESSTNNTFTNNSIYASTGGAFFNGNRWADFGEDSNVNASYNYWGTTDVGEISDSIYDWSDDPSLGNVTFMPLLYEPYYPLPPVLPTFHSCGDNISEDTVLANDLTGCPANGLNISASNVVLDCNGHSISTDDYSDETYGITAMNIQRVVVKNCVLEHFSEGVAFAGTNYTLVQNNTIYGRVGVNDTNVSVGVVVGFASSYPHLVNNTVEGNTIENVTVGAWMLNFDALSPQEENNTIENNRITVFDGGLGFMPSSAIWAGGENFSIINNTVVTRGGGIIGIQAQGGAAGGTGVVIADNTINGCIAPAVVGVYLYGLQGARIEYNTIVNMTSEAILPANGVGILLANGVNGTTIYGNAISGVGYGIVMNDVFGLVPPGNNTYNNVSGNSITYANIGILVANNSVNNTFEYNNIVNSTVFAFVDNNTYAESGMDANVNATNNWWGTADADAINASIYDWKNDPGLGNVTFMPFLTGPYSPPSSDETIGTGGHVPARDYLTVTVPSEVCKGSAFEVSIFDKDGALDNARVVLQTGGFTEAIGTTGSDGLVSFAPSQVGIYEILATYRSTASEAEIISADCTPPPVIPECASDSDCAVNQACASGSCTMITPGTCGYASEHRWVSYGCCADSDCAAEKECRQNVCTEKPVVPPVIVTENITEKERQNATQAIDDAKKALADAKAKNLQTDKAEALLNRAAGEYASGHYAQAQTLAMEAQNLARKAPPLTAPVVTVEPPNQQLVNTLMAAGAALLLIPVIIAILVLWYVRRKKEK